MRKFVSTVAMSVLLVMSSGVGAARADGIAVPAAPQISASGESVTVSWAPVTGADGYRVQISLNGGAYLFVGVADASTYSMQVDDLRSPSLSCGQGPCSVTAEVAATSGAFQSAFSGPSAAVSLPMPYSIPMSVSRRNGPRQVTLVLYGASNHLGLVVHLLKMDRSRIWNDTGVTAVVRRQRVPGHRRLMRAWKFTIVVRTRGLSNYRVEVPAAGPRGEGLSRPYGVRR